MQQADEAVCGRGCVVAWEQLLCKHVEGLGVALEVVDFEDGLWAGQLVALELRVETCSRSRGQGGCCWSCSHVWAREAGQAGRGTQAVQARQAGVHGSTGFGQ